MVPVKRPPEAPGPALKLLISQDFCPVSGFAKSLFSGYTMSYFGGTTPGIEKTLQRGRFHVEIVRFWRGHRSICRMLSAVAGQGRQLLDFEAHVAPDAPCPPIPARARTRASYDNDI